MGTSIHIQQRITERMDVSDTGYKTPCWISNRAAQSNGYTKMGVQGRTHLTHRLAYEAWHGAIPDGMVIDHLCRVRQCCNPDHLEPVTTRENLLRGETKTAMEAAQTHCHRGHEFTVDNTYMRPDRHGRVCRRCRDDATRLRRAHQQADPRPTP